MSKGKSASAMANTSLGLADAKRALGPNDARFYEDNGREFLEALANAKLERDEYGDIAFRFFGRDAQTGEAKSFKVYAPTKKEAKREIRNNGYSVIRIYTSGVYDAIMNHTDGERWDYSAATKVDNALLKKGAKK